MERVFPFFFGTKVINGILQIFLKWIALLLLEQI